MSKKLNSFKKILEEKNECSLKEIEALEEKIDIKDTKKGTKNL